MNDDAFVRQLRGWLSYYNFDVDDVEIEDIDESGIGLWFHGCEPLMDIVHGDTGDDETFQLGFIYRQHYDALFNFAFAHGYRFEFVTWYGIYFEPARTPAEVCAMFADCDQLPF